MITTPTPSGEPGEGHIPQSYRFLEDAELDVVLNGERTQLLGKTAKH